MSIKATITRLSGVKKKKTTLTIEVLEEQFANWSDDVCELVKIFFKSWDGAILDNDFGTTSLVNGVFNAIAEVGDFLSSNPTLTSIDNFYSEFLQFLIVRTESEDVVGRKDLWLHSRLNQSFTHASRYLDNLSRQMSRTADEDSAYLLLRQAEKAKAKYSPSYERRRRSNPLMDVLDAENIDYTSFLNGMRLYAFHVLEQFRNFRTKYRERYPNRYIDYQNIYKDPRQSLCSKRLDLIGAPTELNKSLGLFWVECLQINVPIVIERLFSGVLDPRSSPNGGTKTGDELQKLFCLSTLTFNRRYKLDSSEDGCPSEGSLLREYLKRLCFPGRSRGKPIRRVLNPTRGKRQIVFRHFHNKIPVTTPVLSVVRRGMPPKQRIITCDPTGFLPEHLFYPCAAELEAIQWLLASERIQLSGLERLRLKDIKITRKNVVISHLNKRKGYSQKWKQTMPYTHSTGMYTALVEYKKFVEEYYQLIGMTSYDSESLFISRDSSVRQLFSTTPITNWRSRLKTYHTFSVGSHSRKKLLHGREAGHQKDILTFLGLFGIDLIQQKQKREGQLESGKKAHNVRSFFLNTSNIEGLREEASRDDGFDEETVRPNQIEQEARAYFNGHSIEVERETYVNKSNSKRALSRRREFSEQVGTEMVSIANSLRSEDVELLTFEQLESLLSLKIGGADEESALADLFGLAYANGFEFDKDLIFRGATGQESAFIVDHPITYVFLSNSIDSIDLAIQRASDEGPHRVNLLLARRALLQQLRSRFSAKSIKDSLDWASAQFPTPSIEI